MPTLPVLNTKGKEISKLDLPEKIFGGRVNTPLIHQALVMYRACQRQGTVNTKERADVSGGGAKPYRQKGTGRARHGSSRSPIWKGGGVTFGPHPRDFSYAIPKKMRRAALKESLNAKYQAKEIVCLEELKDKFTKTKDFSKILTVLKLRGKVLALLDGCDESIRLVSRNIPRFDLKRAVDANAYDILRSKVLLITKTSFKNLLDRIEK